jgi:hypothetical protein
MTHHKICDECETVAHCSNHGCIPKVPAPVQEPVDSMGMPLSCGKPFCAPGDHHPLCKLAAQPAPVQKGAIGAEYQKSPWDGKGISMPPPAAQRQWVGLTPDEYRQLEKETTVNGYNGDYCPAWDLIEAVEAKLKEKNT